LRPGQRHSVRARRQPWARQGTRTGRRAAIIWGSGEASAEVQHASHDLANKEGREAGAIMAR
jgi:hypothetical protein